MQALSEDILKKIKYIQFRTNHLINDVMAGEYESAFKGHGMEFEEVREYNPGDDIRTIDWNVTARMNAPFVKNYREERELTIMLLVDISSSMDFGSIEKSKKEIAAEFAALIAYLAIKNNDKVGVVIFKDKTELYIPPKKGKSHAWRIIREILNFQPEISEEKETKKKKKKFVDSVLYSLGLKKEESEIQKETDLNELLEFLIKVSKRKSVVFLISDFQTTGYEETFRIASKKHDLIPVNVIDEREIILPEKIGLVELVDSETGENILVDTFDIKNLQDYKRENIQRLKNQTNFFRSLDIDNINLYTDRSVVDPLVKFFRLRERRL